VDRWSGAASRTWEGAVVGEAGRDAGFVEAQRVVAADGTQASRNLQELPNQGSHQVTRILVIQMLVLIPVLVFLEGMYFHIVELLWLAP
jgi:hypothetical protein